MRRLNKEFLQDILIHRTEADIAAGRVGPVALTVWQDGKEVVSHGFGGADGHSVFCMASMTKPVTAVATLIAVERGLLSLDDPLEKYLPEFANRRVAVYSQQGELIGDEPAHVQLTPRLLLCHSSGYIFDGPKGRFSNMTDEECRTLENSVAACAQMLLAFQPGESNGYSNTVAWDPLLAILQQVTGEDYASFITRELFTPCGMADTGYMLSDEQYARMVPMHNLEDGKSVTVPTKRGWYLRFPNSHYMGCAGLYSTLADYLKFALMLQNGGEINGQRILSEQAVREMATPQLPESANPAIQKWGLGVRVICGEGKRLPIGTFGWSGAFGTHFWVDPMNGITAVYLKNSMYDRGSCATTSINFEKDVMSALQE